MTPLLTVENLAVLRGEENRRRPDRVVRAVDDVSFTLEAGQSLGLVGESGCGKSSLAHAVVRLLEPTSGRIVFDGQDITHASDRSLREVRTQMRMVFQNPYGSLNPRQTVREIVRRPLTIHGSTVGADRRVDELLELVDLEPTHAERRPAELSGGQRQRVAIARALVLEPKLVVLDEPVASLDAHVRGRVLDLLDRLREELSLAYLFIGHDLGDVQRVTDRVAVMYLGQLVEVGPSDTVFRAPLHPYTQALVSAIPNRDPTLARSAKRIVLQGELPDPSDPPSGCRFRTRCWKADEKCQQDPRWEHSDGRDLRCHHATASTEAAEAVGRQ